MPSHEPARPGALPLRPLTTGELLDAAVVLRARPGRPRCSGSAPRSRSPSSWCSSRCAGTATSTARSCRPTTSSARSATSWCSASSPRCSRSRCSAAPPRPGRPGSCSAAPRRPRPRCSPARPGRWCPARSGRPDGRRGGARRRDRLLVRLGFLVLPVPLQVLGIVLAVILTVLFWPVVLRAARAGRAGGGDRRLRPAPGVGAVAAALVARRASGSAGSASSATAAGWSSGSALAEAVVGVVTLVYASPSSTVDNILLGAVWLRRQRARVPDPGRPGRRAAPGVPDAHRGPRHRADASSLRRNTAAGPAGARPALVNPALVDPATGGQAAMTRWWTELIASLAELVPGGIPTVFLLSVVVTILVALLWFFWPSWLPPYEWMSRGDRERGPGRGSGRRRQRARLGRLRLAVAPPQAGQGPGRDRRRVRRRTSCPTSRRPSWPSPPTSSPPPAATRRRSGNACGPWCAT